MCSPSSLTLEVTNTDPHSELLILDLATDSRQFYPGSFTQTSVPPGGSIAFPIVYLPHEVGVAEGTILVQTNVGGFLVQVHGEGAASIYGARPLTGLRVPVGGVHRQDLQLRNPQAEGTLEVKEVFAKGDGVSLSLLDGPTAAGPAGGGEGAAGGGGAEAGAARPGQRAQWQVRPQETKGIVHVALAPGAAGRHQGQVHVKLAGVNGEAPSPAPPPRTGPGPPAPPPPRRRGPRSRGSID